MLPGTVGAAGGLRGKGQGRIHGKRMFLESETSETSKPDASYEKQTLLIVLIWRLRQNTLGVGVGGISVGNFPKLLVSAFSLPCSFEVVRDHKYLYSSLHFCTPYHVMLSNWTYVFTLPAS